ncbi:unnamed protein product [Lactuca virosa]|uniref:Uncharacterized protein n=1 Tax=Lactuca virosa TaxID=75947 RepID=A0AAU9PHJ2_9ASTR|nr:unnamed protein product [Lactuca virosa]
MAVVMGHGGDGGDEPPHPFGGDFGVHQIDAIPPRRRGMAVNKKMHRLYEANGRQPLKIIFDRNTFVPIGDNALVAEVALQTQHIADSGGDPNSIDWIALFEKVLGA